MKKLAITTLIIVGALGVSAYSNGTTKPKDTQAEIRVVTKAEMQQYPDTLGMTRLGRSNLAQAD